MPGTKRSKGTYMRRRSSKGRRPLTGEEVRAFQRRLLKKRRQLLADLDMLEEETLCNGGGAPADREGLAPDDDELYTMSEGLDTAADLSANDLALLREVDAALRRIEEGTYGTCLATGKPISKARLRAIPWAQYCKEHAEREEKRSLAGQWPRIRRQRLMAR